MMKITEASIHSYTTDPRNSNKGTARGREALQQSLERFGAGRAIVAARDRTILAGNKTWEAALEGDFEDVIEVETDGTKLVVVRRTDLDPDSAEAREYALADNRVAELDLSYEPLQIQAMLNDGLDLSWLYERDELKELLQVPVFPEYDEASFTHLDGESAEIKFSVPLPQVPAIEAGIEALMARLDVTKRDKWRVLAHLLEAIGV